MTENSKENVMKRRLYFLFPYPSQVRTVVQQLNDLGVDSTHNVYYRQG